MNFLLKKTSQNQIIKKTSLNESTETFDSMIDVFKPMVKEILNLPPEIEEGNIEYKRKIDLLTKEKIIKFQTQMFWRMNEGKIKNGIDQAIYFVGVDDDG